MLASGDDSGVTVGVNSLSVHPNAYNYLAVGESADIKYSYNIIDGNGGVTAQTATITITGKNDSPIVSAVVTDGSTEDDPAFVVDLLFGASDADTSDVFDVSNLTLVSGDDSGISIGPNSLSVDPGAYNKLAFGAAEVVAYNYDIVDGNGGVVNQSATIRIDGINDAPIGVDDAYTVEKSQTYNGSGLLGNDIDVDDTALTSILNTGPANGSVVVNPNGSFVYTPNPSFEGTDSFTYRVDDGDTTSTPTTVVVDVTSVPIAPLHLFRFRHP